MNLIQSPVEHAFLPASQDEGYQLSLFSLQLTQGVATDTRDLQRVFSPRRNTAISFHTLHDVSVLLQAELLRVRCSRVRRRSGANPSLAGPCRFHFLGNGSHPSH